MGAIVLVFLIYLVVAWLAYEFGPEWFRNWVKNDRNPW